MVDIGNIRVEDILHTVRDRRLAVSMFPDFTTACTTILQEELDECNQAISSERAVLNKLEARNKEIISMNRACRFIWQKISRIEEKIGFAVNDLRNLEEKVENINSSPQEFVQASIKNRLMECRRKALLDKVERILGTSFGIHREYGTDGLTGAWRVPEADWYQDLYEYKLLSDGYAIIITKYKDHWGEGRRSRSIYDGYIIDIDGEKNLDHFPYEGGLKCHLSVREDDEQKIIFTIHHSNKFGDEIFTEAKLFDKRKKRLSYYSIDKKR